MGDDSINMGYLVILGSRLDVRSTSTNRWARAHGRGRTAAIGRCPRVHAITSTSPGAGTWRSRRGRVSTAGSGTGWGVGTCAAQHGILKVLQCVRRERERRVSVYEEAPGFRS